MTREEASKIIKDGIEDMSLDFADDEQYEALTMAIKALEHPKRNVVAVVPCGDTISRQAVLDLVADYDLSMGQVVRGIHALPSVEQEPKTGHWIEMPIGFKCSNCKELEDRTTKYCPNCGAKMVEQERSEEC